MILQPPRLKTWNFRWVVLSLRSAQWFGDQGPTGSVWIICCLFWGCQLRLRRRRTHWVRLKTDPLGPSGEKHRIQQKTRAACRFGTRRNLINSIRSHGLRICLHLRSGSSGTGRWAWYNKVASAVKGKIEKTPKQAFPQKTEIRETT